MNLDPELTPRRFTTDEVARMVEAGILAEDDHLELIDGLLLASCPQGPLHRARTVRVRRILEAAFGEGFHVQDHSPIDGGRYDQPEPDLAVVRGAPEEFEDRHPTGADLVLVVEISVTSQAVDRRKAEVYARAGVPEYWQLDLPARRLTVHQGPRAGGYAVLRPYTDQDQVPLGATRVVVADLLPRTS